jgi:hypothetical protein
MSAESNLTAVAVVRALLNEDIEGLAVLLPDSLPEPARELVVSLASLTVLSAKVAARAEGITAGEYLARIIQIWLGGASSGHRVTRPPLAVPLLLKSECAPDRR